MRLHNLIESLSWAEHLAESNNCNEVFCLGDFFDRSDLNAEEITALQDVYFSKLPHTFITGNHDANVASLDFSSAKIFESIGANVITSVERRVINDKVDFYFIPYITDNILPINNYIEYNDKKKVIFSHNDLAGIQYGRFMSQSGFSISDILENCTLFLNGHLHNCCTINDRILLLGNLTGQNFNEDASKYEHCAHILTVSDDGAITIEPYVNPYALNFYKIRVEKFSDINKLDNLKNNSVVSISCTDKLIHEVEKKVKLKKNIIEYKLIVIYANAIISNDDNFDVTINDHLKQFIEFVQTKIEPSEILTEELAALNSL